MADNSERNRNMLVAYDAGRTLVQLSEDHGLALASIGSILTGERQRRRFSPNPFYRDLRESSF